MSGLCPACRSERSRAAMTVAGHAFRRCTRCRTLWVPDPPPADETAALYQGPDYYSAKEASGAPGESMQPGYTGDYLRDRASVEAKFERVLEHVERYVAPGRLLDVGSGPGFLLAAASRRGWDARGIDVNAWAAEYARDQLGLDVAAGTLADAALEPESFDTVTMMDLLEHVADPEALVAEAARLTRPGGMLVVLTPDAGSPVSRALGPRWPEVQRAGEHLVLLSLRGAVKMLERHGYEPLGWHHEGKASSLETLLEDVTPAAPRAARAAAPVVRGTALGRAEAELDPRTKFALYARRSRRPGGRGDVPVRLPKRVPRERPTEQAVLEELRELAKARRLCDWMFEQFGHLVGGHVVEVGAGIGTFTERVLAAGAERMLLIEPETGCAAELERRFGADDRVAIARDLLPDSPALAERAGEVDFVLCQNVLEHVDDDRAATAAMAAALRPGGHLTLLVPALPRLYGTLDLVYGHWRRYSRERLREAVESAGLEIERLYAFNALGIPGWWLKNRGASASIGPLALRTYDALVVPWRALERRVRPPAGLSLVVHARKR